MEQKIIYELLKRPIAYHPAIAKAFGSVQLAILWSQLYYWKDKGKDPEGWIYKTSEEIYKETGLKRRGQETARKKAEKLGIIEEIKKGMPAKLHYRIDMEQTIKVLGKHCKHLELPEEPKRKPKKKGPEKNKYGEFKHVLLKPEEYQKLLDKFGSKGRDKWIKTLDEGIELKGYSYKSHYLAIIKWSNSPKKSYNTNDSDLVRKAKKDIQSKQEDEERKQNAVHNEKLRDMLRKKEALKKQQMYENK